MKNKTFWFKKPTDSACTTCVNFVGLRLAGVLLVGTFIGAFASPFVQSPPSTKLLKGVESYQEVVKQQQVLEGRVDQVEKNIEHLKDLHGE